MHRARRSGAPAPGPGPPSPPRRRPAPRARRAGSTTPPRAWRRPRPASASSQCWARVDARGPAGVLERPAHEGAVLDPGPVVGEEPHPERRQLGHRRQPLAGPPHGDGPGHRHLGGGVPAQLEHLAGHRRRSRSAARCWAWPPPPCTRRGRRPGAPVSTVSASSRPGWRRWVWRSTRPGATTQPPASSTVAPGRRLEPVGPPRPPCPSTTRTSARRRPPASTTVAAAHQELRHRPPPRPSPAPPPPSSRKSTAMRTATPLVTCRVATVTGRSATSPAISTPRTIGPGWVTTASGWQQRRPGGRSAPSARCTRAATARRPRSPARPAGAAATPRRPRRRASSRSSATVTGQPSSEGGSRLPGRGQRHLGPQRVVGEDLRSGPPGCGGRRPRSAPAGPRSSRPRRRSALRARPAPGAR